MVPIMETTMDPRQPSRLEKKANTIQSRGSEAWVRVLNLDEIAKVALLAR